jgi:hypothetical protein
MFIEDLRTRLAAEVCCAEREREGQGREGQGRAES